jgi:hypothetical protein
MTASPNLTVPVRKPALARWLSADLAVIEIGQRHPLAGGVVSPDVERVEVTVVRTTGDAIGSTSSQSVHPPPR